MRAVNHRLLGTEGRTTGKAGLSAV
uniref:Uncharacterized protein n=1 Tax=Anguilla anguilla TaxID=7936 RepID=A0A0E9UPX4_ANGAN